MLPPIIIVRWDKKPNDEYVLYPERFQAKITVMHSDTEWLTDKTIEHKQVPVESPS